MAGERGRSSCRSGGSYQFLLGPLALASRWGWGPLKVQLGLGRPNWKQLAERPGPGQILQKGPNKRGQTGKNWQQNVAVAAAASVAVAAATAAKIALNWRQPLNAIYQTDERQPHKAHKRRQYVCQKERAYRGGKETGQRQQLTINLTQLQSRAHSAHCRI